MTQHHPRFNFDRSRREQGFTLPELAIVLAIIIITTAIAFPAFLLYQQTNAKNSVIAEVRAAQTKIAASLFSVPHADPIKVYVQGEDATVATGGVAVKISRTDSSNLIKVTNVVNNGSDATQATGTGSWSGYEITGTTSKVSGWYYTYNSNTGKYYTSSTNNATQNPKPYSLPVFTTVSLAKADVGVGYSQQVKTTGNPDATYTATGLPGGLSLNSTTGVISGVPTTQGNYTVIISATNALGTTTKTYALTVQQSPVITTSSISGGAAGQTYSQTITATGTPTPTFAATGLPTGLTLDSTTGVISGTIGANAAGAYTVTVTATNTSGSGTKSFALTVTGAPKITTTSLPNAVKGTAYSTTLAATGYPAPTWALTGPATGLTLDPNTGVLSGTPNVSGQYNLTITATNPTSTDSKTYILTINSGSAITTTSLDPTTVGNTYSKQVNANGYPAPTFTATGLPTGLSINSSGLITGTPAAGTGGAYTVSITATNAYSTDTKTYSLTNNQAPAISTSSLPDTNTYTSYSQTITGTGYPAPTYSVTNGSLPDGYTLNSSTGVISGSTAVPTNYTFNVTATNSVNTATKTYSFNTYKTLPIINPDAETTDTSSWGVYYGPARGFATNASHGGNQSWKITTTGNNLEGMINCTRVGGPWNAGTTVKASMWVIGSDSEQWVVGGRTDYSEGQSGYLYTTTGSGNWQQMSVTYTLTQSTTNICIQMRQTSVSANKWLHADDLQIQVAPAARPLAPTNAGVENGNANGGSNVVGWGTYWSPSQYYANTEQAHSGSWSYKIVTSGNRNDGMIIGPGGSYGKGQTIKVTLWIKGPAGQSWYVSGRQGNPYNEGMGGNYVTTNGSWQQVSATWTLDNDVDTNYIQIWQNGASAGASLYADDFTVTVY